MVNVVVAARRRPGREGGHDAARLAAGERLEVFVWIMLIVRLQATDRVPNILREE